MLTFKNLVAVGLFLFGTTFLWITRDFLANPKEASGSLWSVIQILVFVAIAGFAAAGWGVFKEASWWEPVALVSAIVGVAAMAPYLVGIGRLGEMADAGVLMNVAIHTVGLVVVFAIVLVPLVHDWIVRRI